MPPWDESKRQNACQIPPDNPVRPKRSCIYEVWPISLSLSRVELTIVYISEKYSLLRTQLCERTGTDNKYYNIVYDYDISTGRDDINYLSVLNPKEFQREFYSDLLIKKDDESSRTRDK